MIDDVFANALNALGFGGPAHSQPTTSNKKKFEPLMALCCVLFALCCVGVYRGVRRRSYMSYAGSVLERAFSLT